MLTNFTSLTTYLGSAAETSCGENPPNPVRRLTPHEVDRSSGNLVRRKPPNAKRRVTFHDEPEEMVDDQSMKLRSKRGINYRALAGMK